MFKEIERYAISEASGTADAAAQVYLQSLCSGLLHSSLIPDFVGIDIIPHLVESMVVIRSGSANFTCWLDDIVPSRITSIERHEAPEAAGCYMGSSSVLGFLSSISNGARNPDSSILSIQLREIREELNNILSRGAIDWYISEFLKMKLLSSSIDDDDNKCIALMTPIGPISCMTYHTDNVGERGLSFIHLVNTAERFESLGLASQLYRSMASYCIDSGSWLCRGEPSALTSLSGYERRRLWLRSEFPDLVVVDHQDRGIVTGLITQNAVFSQPKGGQMLPLAIDIINDYRKSPAGDEIGLHQGLSAIACMTQKDFDEWSPKWS